MMMLYHEKQVAALCGVHTLNTLLQGPYFSEIDLAQIAHELDALERQFMQEGGMDSEEYQRFVAEASGNVANDGMFSIQVLSKALQVWSITVIPLDSPDVKDAKAEPQNEQAFICNLQEHWFSIRKSEDGSWWNFNSLFPAPQPLSQFYLSAFLDTLKEQGYTIFVARGHLPVPQYGMEGQGSWFTPEEAAARSKDAEATRQRSKVLNAIETAFDRVGQGNTLTLKTAEQRRAEQQAGLGGFDEELGMGDEDRDMAAAIAASLAGSFAGVQAPGAGAGTSSQQSGPAAAAAAGGGGPGSSQGAAAGVDFLDEDEDPELAAAIAASLQDAPAAKMARTGEAPGEAAAAEAAEATAASAAVDSEEDYSLGEEPVAGEGVLELGFRLPNGQRCMRRFSSSEPIKAMYAFVRQQGLGGGPAYVICTQFPRRELAELDQLLGDAGLGSRDMLNVERKM